MKRRSYGTELYERREGPSMDGIPLSEADSGLGIASATNDADGTVVARTIFKRFSDQKSGSIKINGLEQMVREVHGSDSQDSVMAKAGTLLSMLDTDNSGSVSFTEFQASGIAAQIDAMNSDDPIPEVEDVFESESEPDSDDDESVIMKAFLRYGNADKRTIDPAGMRKMIQETTPGLTSPQLDAKVSEAFQILDTDGDGKVSLAELKAAPIFVQLGRISKRAQELSLHRGSVWQIDTKETRSKLAAEMRRSNSCSPGTYATDYAGIEHGISRPKWSFLKHLFAQSCAEGHTSVNAAALRTILYDETFVGDSAKWLTEAVGAAGEGSATNFLENFLRALDDDGNGTLDFNEFIRAFSQIIDDSGNFVEVTKFHGAVIKACTAQIQSLAEEGDSHQQQLEELKFAVKTAQGRAELLQNAISRDDADSINNTEQVLKLEIELHKAKNEARVQAAAASEASAQRIKAEQAKDSQHDRLVAHNRELQTELHQLHETCQVAVSTEHNLMKEISELKSKLSLLPIRESEIKQLAKALTEAVEATDLAQKQADKYIGLKAQADADAEGVLCEKEKQLEEAHDKFDAAINTERKIRRSESVSSVSEISRQAALIETQESELTKLRAEIAVATKSAVDAASECASLSLSLQKETAEKSAALHEAAEARAAIAAAVKAAETSNATSSVMEMAETADLGEATSLPSKAKISDDGEAEHPLEEMMVYLHNNGKQRIMDLWKILDQDRSGHISQPEFVSGITRLSPTYPPTEGGISGLVQRIFEVVDTDRCGQIQYAELSKGAKDADQRRKNRLASKLKQENAYAHERKLASAIRKAHGDKKVAICASKWRLKAAEANSSRLISAEHKATAVAEKAQEAEHVAAEAAAREMDIWKRRALTAEADLENARAAAAKLEAQLATIKPRLAQAETALSAEKAAASAAAAEASDNLKSARAAAKWTGAASTKRAIERAGAAEREVAVLQKEFSKIEAELSAQRSAAAAAAAAAATQRERLAAQLVTANATNRWKGAVAGRRMSARAEEAEMTAAALQTQLEAERMQAAAREQEAIKRAERVAAATTAKLESAQQAQRHAEELNRQSNDLPTSPAKLQSTIDKLTSRLDAEQIAHHRTEQRARIDEQALHQEIKQVQGTIDQLKTDLDLEKALHHQSKALWRKEEHTLRAETAKVRAELNAAQGDLQSKKTDFTVGNDLSLDQLYDVQVETEQLTGSQNFDDACVTKHISSKSNEIDKGLSERIGNSHRVLTPEVLDTGMQRAIDQAYNQLTELRRLLSLEQAETGRLENSVMELESQVRDLRAETEFEREKARHLEIELKQNVRPPNPGMQAAIDSSFAQLGAMRRQFMLERSKVKKEQDRSKALAEQVKALVVEVPRIEENSQGLSSDSLHGKSTENSGLTATRRQKSYSFGNHYANLCMAKNHTGANASVGAQQIAML